MSPDSPIHLGCPIWTEPRWKGTFLPAKMRSNEFLEFYSRAFNTVEGNTTFYALPKMETAQRWARSVEPGFEFSFKVPRVISHEGGLLSAPQAVRDLFKFLDEFVHAETLGPTFLQLHESFGASRLAELETFCENWPQDLPLAVEVRDHGLFKAGDDRKRLEEILEKHQVDRVIFDSRALFQAAAKDAVEGVAQRKKPNPPVYWTTTGDRPFVRFISGSSMANSDAFLRELVTKVKEWLEHGLHPYIFLHMPDNAHAPELCEKFYTMLKLERPKLPKLDISAAKGDQQELF